MRVLHLTTFLQGGAGRIITALALDQLRAGDEVTVVADAGGEPGYESYPEYVSRLRSAGIDVHTVTSTFKRELGLNIGAARDISTRLARSVPDIVHSHAAIPALIARLALPSTPVLHTMHGWGVRKTPEQAKTDVAIMNRVGAVTTPSAAARDLLVGHGVSPSIVDVVPYGIDDVADCGEVDPADAGLFAALRAGGARIVMCVGTIGPRKNQQLLLEALDDSHLVLIGDGDPAPLIARARELHIADRVHVLGYRADASRYLARADVLVLPSRNEGLPITVLEAFRAGVPVVASDVPELREVVVEGGTGYLFQAEAAASLRAALARAACPPEPQRLAMARRTRAVFAERYTHGRMASAYRDLYVSVIAAQASRACSVAPRHASSSRRTLTSAYSG